MSCFIPDDLRPSRGTRPLTFGSLFAGVGGLDLGLEQAGFVSKWQVEIDPFCRDVLNRHWPGVDRHADVREVGAHNLARVDMIVGGFPCQDISNAGRQAGIEGERSGLWKEYFRIIEDLRPRFVLIENVAALRHRGLGVVLNDLASGGYNAEWDCVPAGSLGATHQRDRIFCFAWDANVSHTQRELRSDVVRPALFHGRAREEFSEWRPADGLGHIEAAGATHPGIPARFRVADGFAGWLDTADLTRRERMALIAQVPDLQAQMKACGNAVAAPVARHVGLCIQEWLARI